MKISDSILYVILYTCLYILISFDTFTFIVMKTTLFSYLKTYTFDSKNIGLFGFLNEYFIASGYQSIP